VSLKYHPESTEITGGYDIYLRESKKPYSQGDVNGTVETLILPMPLGTDEGVLA
jgi:hypothetical protein